MEKTGLIIRRLRMEQKLSQKELCKGICAVSYLSKIEKGTANPSDEIVSLLFSRLHVHYRLDAMFVQDTKQALEHYFEHLIYAEDAGKERDKLLAIREQALQSPLADAYTLFLVYEAFDEHQWDQAKSLLGSVTARETEMEKDVLFFYALARGKIAAERTEGTEWYQKAIHLRPYGIALYHFGKWLYHHGQYQEALPYLRQAYARAAEEGSPYLLLYASDLTGGCYAEMYQEELMLQSFQQTRRLARAINPGMIPGIDYNIGATLVSMRRSMDAMPYLESALQSGYESEILVYHKLAIACFDTCRRQEAAAYLQKAEALLHAGKGSAMEEKLIRIVGFRLQKEYLQSEEYYNLLREVYDGIGKVYHHGFKQFHGNLLIEVCVHNRRYKEALRIAAEVDVFPEFME